MEGALRATGVDSKYGYPCQVEKGSCGSVEMKRRYITMKNLRPAYSERHPGVQNTTLTIDDGLVEVETVQSLSVEVLRLYRGNTKSGEPDTDNRYRTTAGARKKWKTSGVVE